VNESLLKSTVPVATVILPVCPVELTCNVPADIAPRIVVVTANVPVPPAMPTVGFPVGCNVTVPEPAFIVAAVPQLKLLAVIVTLLFCEFIAIEALLV
jgi:hypothetical protein